MVVDITRRQDLSVTIDISFLAVPCAALSIDVMDASGTVENDVSFAHVIDVHKTRITASGKPLTKSEYHTPQSQRLVDMGAGVVMNIDMGAAMKHMNEMEEEAGAHEGCHMKGVLHVKRLAGRINMAVHQQNFMDILPQMLNGHQAPVLVNMSHVIHKLAFGPEFPGQVNPLDGFRRVVATQALMFKYFLKVVPTEYHYRTGTKVETQQYSVSEYAHPIAPGDERSASVEMQYDLSPILVSINDRPPSLLHLAVRLCAVVGGAFALAGLLDKCVDRLVRTVSAHAGYEQAPH